MGVSQMFLAQFEVDKLILGFANEPLSNFPSLRHIKRCFAYKSSTNNPIEMKLGVVVREVSLRF